MKATRFNYYEDGKQWKPFHHDAAAIDSRKAKSQNVTVGVSFGSTRSIQFLDGSSRTKLDIPLYDGFTYAFGKDVNIIWKHGIPKLQESETSGPRFSIIVWGYQKKQQYEPDTPTLYVRKNKRRFQKGNEKKDSKLNRSNNDVSNKSNEKEKVSQ